MAQSSPSEFLTFYRRFASTQAVRASSLSQPLVARSFHASAASRHTGNDKPKEHATRKGDSLDIQSGAIKRTSESKTNNDGGAAVREKDEKDSVSRAKKDHPEAPDTAIGMQDERGGKGH